MSTAQALETLQPSSGPSSSTSSGAAPQEHDVVIREAGSEDDIIALHRLRMIQGEEHAVAPVNAIKVMAKLDRALRDPESFILLMAIADGHLIGYLLLQKVSYDFSDTEILRDFGFYVLPDWRKKDVGLRLLEDARIISDLTRLPVCIDIFNPRTRRRGGKIAKAAEVIGYTPIGSVVTFNPRTEGD